MSCSKWAYEPEYCDGEPCPGDCDLCGKAQENEDRRQEKEEHFRTRFMGRANGKTAAGKIRAEIRTCAECLYWNYTMAEAPCRGCMQDGKLTRWVPERSRWGRERKVEANLFDIVEEHHDCTVQILKNSVTGERSFAWYPNDQPPARIGQIEE